MNICPACGKIRRIIRAAFWGIITAVGVLLIVHSILTY